MLCLVIYALHNLSMFLNVASKRTFLAKPLNTFFVVVVVLFNLNCFFFIFPIVLICSTLEFCVKHLFR